MKPIEDRIRAAFDEYRATLTLIEDMALAQDLAQEIVILACARLDALANLAMTKQRSQNERFVSFLMTYSGKSRELEQIALPNMYFNLFVQSVTLPATVPAPGRLYAYDIKRDALFLQHLVDSGVPMTTDAIGKWLHRLSVWLQRKYRTTATQSKQKPHQDTLRNIMQHLEDCSSAYRKGFYDEAVKAIGPFVRRFRLAEVLYRDYRSRSIHEFPFDADERFFEERGLYVATRYHAWDSTRFLEMSVSARWLINLYRVAVERYEQSLLARRKLPINLWTELCDTNKEFGFLDDASITVGRDLRIHVDR